MSDKNDFMVSYWNGESDEWSNDEKKEEINENEKKVSDEETEQTPLNIDLSSKNSSEAQEEIDDSLDSNWELSNYSSDVPVDSENTSEEEKIEPNKDLEDAMSVSTEENDKVETTQVENTQEVDSKQSQQEKEKKLKLIMSWMADQWVSMEDSVEDKVHYEIFKKAQEKAKVRKIAIQSLVAIFLVSFIWWIGYFVVSNKKLFTALSMKIDNYSESTINETTKNKDDVQEVFQNQFNKYKNNEKREMLVTMCTPLLPNIQTGWTVAKDADIQNTPLNLSSVKTFLDNSISTNDNDTTKYLQTICLDDKFSSTPIQEIDNKYVEMMTRESFVWSNLETFYATYKNDFGDIVNSAISEKTKKKYLIRLNLLIYEMSKWNVDYENWRKKYSYLMNKIYWKIIKIKASQLLTWWWSDSSSWNDSWTHNAADQNTGVIQEWVQLTWEETKEQPWLIWSEGGLTWWNDEIQEKEDIVETSSDTSTWNVDETLEEWPWLTWWNNTTTWEETIIWEEILVTTWEEELSPLETNIGTSDFEFWIKNEFWIFNNDWKTDSTEDTLGITWEEYYIWDELIWEIEAWEWLSWSEDWIVVWVELLTWENEETSTWSEELIAWVEELTWEELIELSYENQDQDAIVTWVVLLTWNNDLSTGSDENTDLEETNSNLWDLDIWEVEDTQESYPSIYLRELEKWLIWSDISKIQSYLKNAWYLWEDTKINWYLWRKTFEACIKYLKTDHNVIVTNIITIDILNKYFK